MQISNSSKRPLLDYRTLCVMSEAVELAWKKLATTGVVFDDEVHNLSVHDRLAEYIVALGHSGERDITRLAEAALDHVLLPVKEKISPSSSTWEKDIPPPMFL